MSQQSQARAARAAAELAAQRARERRRNIRIGGLVVLLMVAIVAAGFLGNRLTGAGEVDASTGSAEHSLVVGPASAPHTVVVYEDFLCPYCGELERSASDRLTALAEDGRVRVEYRPFNLLTRYDYSRESLEVFAAVLQTAGPEVAKAFHDDLYADQPSESGPFPSVDDLVRRAVAVGADEGKVTDALDGEGPSDWADAATDEAASAGVQGTPTVVLDGTVFTDYTTTEELAKNLVAAVS